MVYRVIGLMSGSSLDGLDIAFVEFSETGGRWTYLMLHADCVSYTDEWKEKLATATELTALNYQLLHTAYGHFIGETINAFVDKYHLHHRVNLIASHGHTTFHLPAQQTTAQLGDGAAIAAITQTPVVSDLRSMDLALGGQGAPIVPIGEQLLLSEYDLFLNIGGIANISANTPATYIAFDVCAANRVLNMLVAKKGLQYDDGGKIASSGIINGPLLQELNQLPYYIQSPPKSLANSFGISTVYPIIERYGLSIEDALCTYTEHIAMQVAAAVDNLDTAITGKKMLVTGGGAFNTFLVKRLTETLAKKSIALVVPGDELVQYKEALIMALIGVLRWREEVNVLASVTGASKNSIGGALWLGDN